MGDPVALEPLIKWDMVQSIKDLGIRIDNPNYCLKILDLFETQSIDMLSKMEASLKENEPSHLAQIAHSLKGSSLCMGANRLAALCHRIESEFRTDKVDWHEISSMVEKVKQTYAESLRELKRGLPSL